MEGQKGFEEGNSSHPIGQEAGSMELLVDVFGLSSQ